MAQEKNNKELKQRAIANLRDSRAELSTEMKTLRRDLSPGRIMHRMVDHHKPVVVGIGAAAGLLAALMVYRVVHRDKSHHWRSERDYSKPPRTGPGIVGILAQAILPILVKSAIKPALIQSFISKRPPASSDNQV